MKPATPIMVSRWAIMGRALTGDRPPWAPMGQTQMGPAGPSWAMPQSVPLGLHGPDPNEALGVDAPGPNGPPGVLGPVWAITGRALVGPHGPL